MINLKLAEYEGEKFERFLNQEDSEYFPPDWENFIIYMENGKEFNFENTKFLLGKDFVGFRYCIPYEGEAFSVFKKDKKDPLKRFNGLFDGITYGEGRFVLIQDEDFGVYEQKFFDKKHEEFGYGLNLNGNISCTFKNATSFTGKYVDSTSPKLIGNLMENPELYEKLK
jgi:hypothetical protein